MDSNKKSKRSYTKLSQHKHFKKILKPPLLTLPGLKRMSWIDERLPEILWAILVIGNVDRSHALDYFRKIGEFVKRNPECCDITLSSIADYPTEKRDEFISIATTFSDDVNAALSALTLFPTLPCFEAWRTSLENVKSNQKWNIIGKGVLRTLDHQSQEATDCRWVKVLCMLLAGKIKYHNDSQNFDYLFTGVIEFPNSGDMTIIRPFIRAAEMGLNMQKENNVHEWSKQFWEYCLTHTKCIPEGTTMDKVEKYKEAFKMEDKNSEAYMSQTIDVRNGIVEHLYNTRITSGIDSRHEGVFGLVLYSVSLFIETIVLQSSFSASGRLTLRALADIYITLKYLQVKEVNNMHIWDTYRGYGSGQLKLALLKLEESDTSIDCVTKKLLYEMANEDEILEFVPINLGHMSIEAGVKDVYDNYYTYTSGFVHGNWGSIRESVYQKCLNPLHRLHRIPTPNLPILSSVMSDALLITNKILECLSAFYPGFNKQFLKI